LIRDNFHFLHGPFGRRNNGRGFPGARHGRVILWNRARGVAIAIAIAVAGLCSGGLGFPTSARGGHRIDVLAGTGQRGYAGDGGAAAAAQLDSPFGIVRGPDGALYICDTGNHVVRRVDPSGVIATVAGTGERGYAGDGGAATKAKLNEPYEVRFDRSGDLVFVEMQNHIVRKVTVANGIITTIAGTGERGFGGDGGPAVAAKLNQPHSIQFAPDGDLYICDIGNHRLRRVAEATGLIDTVSGNGRTDGVEDGAPFAGAPLNGPRAIDFDREGNAWLALREGNRVYRLDFATGTLHHVAGTGAQGFTGNGDAAAAATLSGPKGISVDAKDAEGARDARRNIYLADTESHSIRMIDRAVEPPVLRLIAGTGQPGPGTPGDALKCRMARPHGVYVDKDGAIYVGDTENHRVWVIRDER